jgi:hypothetical protein
MTAPRFGNAETMLRCSLQAAGYFPIPLVGKKPVADGWQKFTNVSRDEILSWEKRYSAARNTGLLTCRTPTFDCDILDADATTAVEGLLRKRIGKRGQFLKRVGLAPKFAVPFCTDVPFKKIKISLISKDGNAGEKLEFLCDGQQFVADGIHPDTGQPFQWTGGDPCRVQRKDLPPIDEKEARALIEDAARLLIDEHGYRRYQEEKRKERGETAGDQWGKGKIDWSDPIGSIVEGIELHDNIRDLAASMIGSGVSPRTTTGLIEAVMKASTIKHDKRWQERYDDIGRTVDNAVEKFSPQDDAAPLPTGGNLFDPWAPFEVPPFPIEVFPGAVQEFVTAQGEVIGCDLGAMSMATLTAVSGAIDHRCTLKMMRHGNWYVSPRLWVLLSGDSATKKTPEINAVTLPLEQYQNDLQHEYRMQLQGWKMAGEKKDEKPEPPIRLVTYDSTIEALGELLARSGRGLLVKRDEFSGWIGAMEKYGGGRRGANNDRAFWLKAHDGGTFVVDRIGRGELFIENMSVSLIGGIQPAKLAELQGLTSDGLLQRFIPTILAPATLPKDKPINTDAFDKLIERLIKADPVALTLSDAALETMAELQKHLFKLQQDAGGLAMGFQEFVNKLVGYTGTLALILHLLDESKSTVVQKATAENVNLLITEFVLPHALEFYRAAETHTHGDRLRKLASFILTKGAEKIVASDITSNVWNFRGLTLSEVHERVSPLVAAGWLKPIGRAPVSHAWDVNPAVFEQFNKRRKDEEDRKVRLTSLLTHK